MAEVRGRGRPGEDFNQHVGELLHGFWDGPMSGLTIATLMIVAGIVTLMLMWPSLRPSVRVIDSVDLMRLQDVKKAINRRRWVRWVIITIIAILLVFMLWGFSP